MRGLICVTLAVLIAQNGANPVQGRADELASAAKEVFRSRCFECHGGSSTNAGVEVLNHEQLLVELEYVVAGSPEDSMLYELITTDDDGLRMPPVQLPSLTQSEVDTIRRWIADGAKPFPEDVAVPDDPQQDDALANVAGAEYLLDAMLQYLSSIPLRERQFIRFFSAHHLLTAGATADELALNHEALAKTINHLSMQPGIVRPDIVDPETKSIFAVDIRRVGWHKQPFKSVGELSLDRPMNLYDLVLLEYPYATIHQDSETYDRLVEQYFDVARPIRPIPYVRVDWFVSVATQSPLYEDMLQLPQTLDELERQLGVDSTTNLESRIAKRAGMTVSGVSQNNRVVERHPSVAGAYWKSFDFASSKGQENIFTDPIEFRESGGEMIFNLPNGLQGYFVTDAVGQRITEAPTSIVTDKFAQDQTVRNGLSCIRCHDRGIKTFKDTVRPAVAGLPGTPGFSKRQVLDLYPPHEEMDQLVSNDEDRFMSAMASLLDKAPEREPLIPVTAQFLDRPIQLSRASGELGLKSPEGLTSVFRTPTFTGFGLAALASGGAVRRDMWEDFYDRIVRQLGLGLPVVAIDGLTKPDYLADATASQITLKTNKSSNVFAPGDQLAIVVENDSPMDMHIELIGTSISGKKVVLMSPSTVIKRGEQLRFPSSGSIKIQPNLGRELITLYASVDLFPAARIMRAKNVADRVVHPVYELDRSTQTINITFDPSTMIKKTIAIETR